MNHAALFNGIGGFQLAAEWMGWNNHMSCEIDNFCNRVTKYHFPNCIQHNDIRTTDFTIYKGRISILTGGFPCQPYSVAGLQQGTEDERHLWPEMLRAIREIQPRWVVGENVRGLINWADGLVFHEVQTDLEAAGYEVFPFLLPAAGVNAPHERYRIWFVAHARCDGYERRRSCENRSATSESESKGLQRKRLWNDLKRNGIEGIITDTNKFHGDLSGFRTSEISQQQASGILKNNDADASSARREKQFIAEISNNKRYCAGISVEKWRNFPTQSPVCDGNDGFSSQLDGITFPKWRNASIKAGGNAIVPQVALQIFKAIEQYNNLINKG